VAEAVECLLWEYEARAQTPTPNKTKQKPTKQKKPSTTKKIIRF
jgi:hypothetical protein